MVRQQPAVAPGGLVEEIDQDGIYQRCPVAPPASALVGPGKVVASLDEEDGTFGAGRRTYLIEVPSQGDARRLGERVDDRLVARAQQGDRDAFTQIVYATLDRFHAVAMRLLRDRQLAQDAVQQAMVNIWRDLPRLRDPDRYDAWSYRLLVRACYTEYKHAPHWMPAIEIGTPSEPPAADEYGAVLDRDQLERGFRRLSMDHRVVVVLHHYLDLPLEQVADVLDVPIGTIKSRLHRALAEMRAALEADSRPSGPLPRGRYAEPTTPSGQQVMR